MVLSASAASLIDTIERLDEWDWARTNAVLGEVQSAKHDVVSGVHELVNVHIGEGWKAVVDQVPDNELQVTLQQIATEMEPKLETLENAIKRVKEMHQRILR